MSADQKDIFENKSVPKAILKLALPSIFGQIILVIYNMADTFFVGLTRSDVMISAVTVCLPAFMFLSAISNLFGIGGGAAYSRALGSHRYDRCDNIVTHALYGCVLAAAAYSLLAFAFKDRFVDMLGGIDPAVHESAVQYLTVTVVIGGLSTACGTFFSHLIRAEGFSLSAGIGVALGGLMNILLDPLFMFVILPKGHEVLGAGLATFVSNLISCIFFIAAIRRSKTINFRYHGNAFSDGTVKEILLTGLPACLMTLFENISYSVLNRLVAEYGVAAQAGVGVAKKINMLAHCIVRGLSQGVMPLLAYSYASGNRDRLKQTAMLSSKIAVLISFALTVLYYSSGKFLVSLFVKEGSLSCEYGILFLKILCLGCPFSAYAYSTISFFQATNRGFWSFLLAILRKGAIDIPMMILLKSLLGMKGIVAATPLTDILCCIIASILMNRWMKQQKNKRQKTSS